MVVSIGVCTAAVISSKYMNRDSEPEVAPPTMMTAIHHLVSVICFLVALLIASYSIDLYSRPIHDFYRYAIPVGGVIAVVFLGLQIVLLYMQSRRAMYTEMNKRLNTHTR